MRVGSKKGLERKYDFECRHPAKGEESTRLEKHPDSTTATSSLSKSKRHKLATL